MTIAFIPAGRRLRHLRLGLAALGIVLLAGCPGSGSSDLSGTYQAGDSEGTMTLEFKSGHKVHMTMQPAGGQPDATDGDYMIDGNKVTIQVPGGFPLALVRNGNTLEGSVMGQIMHFEKK